MYIAATVFRVTELPLQDLHIAPVSPTSFTLKMMAEMHAKTLKYLQHMTL
jgi:hypothetical protein